MGKINLLDNEISDKIAAGEVVERPMSVVKELVENSIDAGATRISVEIKNGGSTYIKISDNGSGMEKDDATVAFLRHATSKISSVDDLDAIYTLGFRGEALSSIGAVSRVDLYTKRSSDESGTHTICEGGDIVSAEDTGIPDGTTFLVRNLFYNVPARMKFLKKDATEAGYISDIMVRFILSHPEIAFTFINNSKTVLSSQGDGRLQNAVYAVYGRDYATAMLPVDFQSENIKISGLTGKGSTARPNRNYQSFFINGRYVKSPLIMRAVEEAYKNQIMIGKFPTSVLNIEINPKLTDINVHPTKLEVKFSNENEIYRAVYNAVKESLYSIMDIPKIERTETKREKPFQAFERDNATVKKSQIEITAPTPLNTASNPPSSDESKKEPAAEAVRPSVVASPQFFERSFEKKAEAPKAYSEITGKETEKIPEFVPEAPEENSKPQAVPEPAEEKKAEEAPEERPEEKKPTEFKLVGQIFDTYIIIETDGKMMLIDQHAAHERLKYEELKKEIESSKIYSQTMAIPAVASLTSSEMAVFLQNTDFMGELGFEAERLDESSVIIRAVPSSQTEDVEDLFVEILSMLSDNKREIISEKRQRLLYTIACKAAIKANHRLDKSEQTALVQRVLELDNINTCPHGRPIIVSMTLKEIEKEFKRII